MFGIHSLQSTLIAEPVKFVGGLGIKPTGWLSYWIRATEYTPKCLLIFRHGRDPGHSINRTDLLVPLSHPTSAHNSPSTHHSTISSRVTKTQSASPPNEAGTCSTPKPAATNEEKHDPLFFYG
jgi:hypothetical protein